MRLDPALLWPAVSLERWALHGARDGSFHMGGRETHRPPVPAGDEPEVRAWQRREFEAELEAIARMPL